MEIKDIKGKANKIVRTIKTLNKRKLIEGDQKKSISSLEHEKKHLVFRKIKISPTIISTLIQR